MAVSRNCNQRNMGKTANSWNNFVAEAKTQFGGIMAGMEAVGTFLLMLAMFGIHGLKCNRH